eukprot:234728-Lingulodinium_polyedra.AAC.1
MDTFTLADYLGNNKVFLNAIDVASRFGIVSQVNSRHPIVVWSGFLQSWAAWAGFPRCFLVDGGGEFER